VSLPEKLVSQFYERREIGPDGGLDPIPKINPGRFPIPGLVDGKELLF
jgi:hypothetical protein